METNMVLFPGHCVYEFWGSSFFLFPFSFLSPSLVAQTINDLPVLQETWVQSLGQKDPQEKGMATHCSILAWRIPWAEEPGGLQSMGTQRVGHDWVTKHSITVSVLDTFHHSLLKTPITSFFPDTPLSPFSWFPSSSSGFSVSTLFTDFS